MYVFVVALFFGARTSLADSGVRALQLLGRVRATGDFLLYLFVYPENPEFRKV